MRTERICLLLSYFVSISCQNFKCVPRMQSDYESPICVCNATYCDTIFRVEPLPSSNEFLYYTTSKSGLRFEPMVKMIVNGTNFEDYIKIDSDKTYQTFIGMGGAITDAAGININSLNGGARTNFLRSYFSDEGIEYSMARIPIGGTDFSTHFYSYDDGKKDVRLKNFHLAKEDFMFKIPIIKEAYNLTGQQLKLLGSAWVAPVWMLVSNQNYTYLRRNMYQTWADYHLKFLQAYENERVGFWGVTTGNEPDTSKVERAVNNTVSWNSHNMATWISNHLGPTLRKSQFSDIKILVYDDTRNNLNSFVNEVFSNRKAKDYIDGVAVHWYNDYSVSPNTLASVHQKYPNKFLMNTEASFMGKVNLGSWQNAELYAADIIQDLNNWMGGWIDWNIALDPMGGPTFSKNYCDSPIIVNSTSGEFYKQPMFYALGHFSKFITRGSVRVHHTSSNINLQSVAFKRPDGGLVVIILNSSNDIVVTTIMYRGRLMPMSLPDRSLTTILHW